MACQKVLEIGKTHGSALSPEHLACTEEHERRHRLDAVSGGQWAILVNVYLDDADVVAKVGFQLLEHGVHLFARATPGGEEIYQGELVAIDDVVEFFHDVYWFLSLQII